MYSHKFNNNRIIFKPINGRYVCVSHGVNSLTLADYLDELLIQLDPNCTKAQFEYDDNKGNKLYTVMFDSWSTTCIVTLTINIYTRDKSKLPPNVAAIPSHLVNIKV